MSSIEALKKKNNIMLGQEQYIKNTQGEPEFIVIPAAFYEKLIELIEDYGLGAAIKEAENSNRYNKEEALRFLENEN